MVWQALRQSEDPVQRACNSVIVATISTLIATVHRHRSGARRGARASHLATREALLFAPMIIPDIVLAIALLSFFTLLKFSLGLHSIIMAHVVFNIAFVCGGGAGRGSRGFDWSLTEVSRDLGAGPFATFWRITLPLILPVGDCRRPARLHAVDR